MGAGVTQRAASGALLVKAPLHRLEVAHAPRLDIAHLNAVDRAELTALHKALDHAHGRQRAVVVTAGGDDTHALGFLVHLVGLLRIKTQRLFAKDVLARADRLDRDLTVQVVRRGNDDDVRFFVRQERAPVRRGAPEAELLHALLRRLRGMPDDALQTRLHIGRIIINWIASDGERMQLSHEAGSDHTDSDCFHVIYSHSRAALSAAVVSVVFRFRAQRRVASIPRRYSMARRAAVKGCSERLVNAASIVR